MRNMSKSFFLEKVSLGLLLKNIAIMRNFVDSLTKMQVQEFKNIKLINRKPMKNLQEERVFVIKQQV